MTAKQTQQHKSAMRLIAYVLAALMLVGGGYYIYMRQSGPPTAQIVSSAGVTTYTDPTRLYSIKYPSNWEVRDDLPVLEMGQPAGKQHSLSIVFPGGSDTESMNIVSDKTPVQAKAIEEAWGPPDNSSEPYTVTTINGYKAFHRHIESDEADFKFVEDAYTIFKDDQSSLVILLQSKNISEQQSEFLPNFDNTSRLPEFKKILDSITFL